MMADKTAKRRLHSGVRQFHNNKDSFETARFESRIPIERAASRSRALSKQTTTIRSCHAFFIVLSMALFHTAPHHRAPAVVVEALLPRASSETIIGRRGALEKVLSLTAGVATAMTLEEPQPAVATEDSFSQSSSYMRLRPSSSLSSSSFDAYCLTPEEHCVRSKLDKIEGKEFISQLATTHEDGGSVWLGDHHGSVPDHEFQAMVVREVHRERKKHDHLRGTPMAVGLEPVQSRFQPVLDDYVSGKISLAETRRRVEWDKRWSWSFDSYREIFVAAKELGIRLLALNVDAEDLAVVEKEGYPGLPVQQLNKYITDPVGFADFVGARGFEAYSDSVIKPSFALHQRLGLTRYATMTGEELDAELTFGRFLSGRHLRDEGMASSALAWCADHPGGLLVGLVGADHVKYGHGVPGRFARMARTRLSPGAGCASVVINPTLSDSRPSLPSRQPPAADDPERITLQLRYPRGDDPAAVTNNRGGGDEVVLSFSDYVVVT